MITTAEKQKIQEALRKYVQRYQSQNKAAKSLHGVSSATISQILNGKDELVTDNMYRNIASQIEAKSQSWVTVETGCYQVYSSILNDAKQFSNVYAVIGEAGTGKTATANAYVANNDNAYRLKCNEYWNRKYFLVELLRVMGRDSSGLTVAEMMHEVVTVLKKKHQPLIIMDEVDKLSDQVFYFFITIYNELEDHCGIVLSATDHFEKRMRRGLKLNKKGYKEIFSRIGRKYIELPTVNHADVIQICTANGVTDQKEIKAIYQDCEGDLRRVKRKIHASKQKEL